MMKLLLVEDERVFARSVAAFLEREDFLVETANNYQEACLKLDFYRYDLVLVDINLPDGSGMDIVRKIQRNPANPGVVIVSGHQEVDIKIAGLDLGADDYITKPFHLGELAARLRSIIRRRLFDGKKSLILGDLEICPASHDVRVNGKNLILTPTEYNLLLLFMANRNRVLSRETIGEHLMREDEIADADSFDFVYAHVKNLRKKISRSGGRDPIRTVYGQGYKMMA